MLVRPGIGRPDVWRCAARDFTLPVDAARLKAREIIDQSPQSGYLPIVENWRQLSDGKIEFTMRRLPAEGRAEQDQ
jgi:hypothetical protein